MGERIRDFSVRHTILFCIAVEIAGLAALIIFGGIIVLALPEADYYIQMLLQETAAAALAWWMMKVCGMGDVVKKKGYGFASGLLASTLWWSFFFWDCLPWPSIRQASRSAPGT